MKNEVVIPLSACMHREKMVNLLTEALIAKESESPLQPDRDGYG